MQNLSQFGPLVPSIGGRGTKNGLASCNTSKPVVIFCHVFWHILLRFGGDAQAYKSSIHIIAYHENPLGYVRERQGSLRKTTDCHGQDSRVLEGYLHWSLNLNLHIFFVSFESLFSNQT